MASSVNSSTWWQNATGAHKYGLITFYCVLDPNNGYIFCEEYKLAYLKIEVKIEND
jgi:hypothetical protein